MRTLVNIIFWGSLIVMMMFWGLAMVLGLWRLIQWSPWTILGISIVGGVFGISGHIKSLLSLDRP